MLGHKKEADRLPHTPNLSRSELLSPEILQDPPISGISVFSEHFNFTKGRKVKIFSQKLGKINKRSHNFSDSARLHITFTDVIRGNRFDRDQEIREMLSKSAISNRQEKSYIGGYKISVCAMRNH